MLRAYAPVGGHEDLLPYLVRRLLENGANTSFVHALLDERVPAEKVVIDPITAVEAAGTGRTRQDPAAGRHLWGRAQELAGPRPVGRRPTRDRLAAHAPRWTS